MHLVESFNMKIGSKFFNVVYRFFYYKEYFSCFPFFVVVFVKLRLRERLDIRTPPGWRGGVRRAGTESRKMSITAELSNFCVKDLSIDKNRE